MTGTVETCSSVSLKQRYFKLRVVVEVSVGVRACVRAQVCACVCARARARVCVRVRACLVQYHSSTGVLYAKHL